MIFEWDPEKSEKVKKERGASFEELAAAILSGSVLDRDPSVFYPDQIIWVVRHQNEIWAVVTEKRGEVIRLVTAYPNRKLRRRYEKD